MKPCTQIINRQVDWTRPEPRYCYRIAWMLHSLLLATFRKLPAMDWFFLLVVANVFNTDSHVTIWIGKFLAGNYGLKRYQIWITIHFLDWLLIACFTSSYVTIYLNVATTVKQATSYGFWLHSSATWTLCKSVLCSSSYAFIHEQNQELPAMVFVACVGGYGLYYSTTKY